MSLGPVELLVISFPGERLSEDALDAIGVMIARGEITILDVVIVRWGVEGNIEVVEFDQDPDLFGLNHIWLRVEELTSSEDIATIAENLPQGRSAAIVVYEHTWSRRLTAAIGHAGGNVDLHVRISPEVVENAVRAAASNDIPSRI